LEEAIRPWRRATITVSLIAALELVLLIAAGAVILAPPLERALHRHAVKAAQVPQPKPATAAPIVHKAPPAPKPSHPRAGTSVLVLNGNGRNGAAHAEAVKLEGLGYRIAGAADARRHDYATTVVMYKAGFRAEGLRLARDLHVGAVGPLDGLGVSALEGGQLAVIIGAR
jgi:hypothetical protein